jgi:hypothetical protein
MIKTFRKNHLKIAKSDQKIVFEKAKRLADFSVLFQYFARVPIILFVQE